MSESPNGPLEIDPEEAGRREFAKSRRGFDQNEVRAHLLLLAAELKRLRAESDEAVRKAARLESRLGERDSLDPATVTRLLGEETARVLESAREAAEEIRLRAQTESDKLVEDSKERAASVREDTELLRANAARESDELLASARQQAQDLTDESRSAADEVRRHAEEAAEQMREEAASVLGARTREANDAAEVIREASALLSAEAEQYATGLRESTDAEIAELRLVSAADAEERSEQIVEGARERGRAMVAEAKEARERMLRDLAERRKVARRQLEAMRAGRERLLESFSAARTALDGATEDLVDSLPAAREAANEAAQGVDENIDSAVAELEAEIGAGSDLSGDFESDLEAEMAMTAGDGAGSDEAPSADLSVDGPDSGDSGSTGLGESGSSTSAESAAESTAESTAGPDLTEQESAESRSHLRLIPSDRPAASTGDDDDDDDDDDGDEGPEEREQGAVAPVDDLFARLRADTTTPAAADDPEAVLDTQHLSPGAVVIDLPGNDSSQADNAPADSAPTDNAKADKAGADTTEGSAESDDSSTEPIDAEHDDQAILELRDELTEGLEGDINKRLKRLLSDQENKLLDRVRRDRKAKTPSELLPTAEEASEELTDVVSGLLAEAADAGSAFLERRGVTVQTMSSSSIVEEMLSARDEMVLVPIRARLVEIVENSGDDSRDRNELVARLRSVYRDWRSEKLTQATGDMVTLAFNRGIVAAAPSGSSMCWLVDNGGLPCPDAEDNHLAGSVPVGDAYPTGDVCPTAHPGCRCLLVPADG